MTEVEIIAMKRNHITDLMRYERPMFGAEAWSASAYREELADTTNRYYIAAVDGDGELLGWAGLRILDAEAEVLTVGVIPSARRRGIGSALLADLLDEARRRRVEEVFLDVRVDNDDAQRIYAREGFVAVGRRRGYYDNGRTDSLTMKLAVTP
jgi:ribosomal-protein-alanine N-acetyltransferase